MVCLCRPVTSVSIVNKRSLTSLLHCFFPVGSLGGSGLEGSSPLISAHRRHALPYTRLRPSSMNPSDVAGPQHCREKNSRKVSPPSRMLESVRADMATREKKSREVSPPSAKRALVAASAASMLLLSVECHSCLDARECGAYPFALPLAAALNCESTPLRAHRLRRRGPRAHIDWTY